MPQSALFILFDVIVESPTDPGTKKSLSHLQILVAYFARLAYATGNELIGSVPSEFFQMATKFVQEVNENGTGCVPHNSSAIHDLAREYQAAQSGIELQETVADDMFGFQVERTRFPSRLPIPVVNLQQGPPFLMYNAPPLDDLDFLFPDHQVADFGVDFGFEESQTGPRFDVLQ